MIEGYTRRAIEAMAVERYGPRAKLVTTKALHEGSFIEWIGVMVGQQAIGFRRSIDELPTLIRRGPAMEAIKVTRCDLESVVARCYPT